MNTADESMEKKHIKHHGDSILTEIYQTFLCTMIPPCTVWLRIAAASLGHAPLVHELLKANAQVDAPNQNGVTCLNLRHELASAFYVIFLN